MIGGLKSTHLDKGHHMSSKKEISDFFLLHPLHLVYYCTISFNLDKGVTCDTLSELLVSDTFQKDGDRVILPPT